MPNTARGRRTIGVLSTWSIYEGATIDQYAHTLLQGVCAAARDRDSHLLLGCGISLPGRAGDSAERLAAYHQWLRDAGIAEDPRLIAYGEHRRGGGRAAMERILATGAPFTALLASNDLSCLGAIEVLRATGRRIPDDVAVIGFDNILDTRSHLPPLTSVRHPTFALGYQAVLRLLDLLAGKHAGVIGARVPTRLVVRQSCGCRPESARLIVGLSEMVLREQRGHPPISGAAPRDMEQIHASARHLDRLIGDVLDLASSEAGQLHLMREPLDLVEMLRMVATIGERMARDKGLDWRSRLADRQLWVHGDRTRLRQIVLNLISNAVKFTSSGVVELEVTLTEQQATVLVSDTGIGVPRVNSYTILDNTKLQSHGELLRSA